MRDFLTQHGVPFVERNIRNDASAKQELIDRTGQMLVPIVFVDDQSVMGWDEERLASLLGIHDR